MLAVTLAIGASLGWGVSDFLGGLKSRSMPLLAVLLASQGAALVLLTGIVLVLGEGPPAIGFVLLAVIAGLGETVGAAALYRGLAVGVMSIVAPVAAAAPAVALVVGLLAGEVPTPLQGVALALVVVGIVVTSAVRGNGPAASSPTSSVFYGLLSAAGFGTYFVAMDAASEGTIAWALLAARLTAVATIATAALFTRSRLGLRGGDLPMIVSIGFLIVAADGMFAIASTVGALVVVAVLSALHPVVTIGLARIYLHERIEPRQHVGIAACLLGALAITASS
jgi:drug/metabolite transporter (DMT)-like permease